MKIEKKYKILLIIITIILSITMLTLTIKDRKLTCIERLIKDSILYIEKIVYKPINYVGGKVDDLKTLFSANKLYLEIKEKEEKYDSLKVLCEEKDKVISDLKSTLELNTTLEEFSKINATIISRDISSWYDFVIIDKGEKNGVNIGDAVINNKGLIGSVTSVSNFNSTVKLLTGEYNNKISIKINNSIFGLIVGYEDDFLVIEGIAENTKIDIDNNVITSGLGNNFPSGIMVGNVSKITTDNFDLAKTVLVKPSVDFDDLNYVTVIKKEPQL